MEIEDDQEEPNSLDTNRVEQLQSSIEDPVEEDHEQVPSTGVAGHGNEALLLDNQPVDSESQNVAVEVPPSIGSREPNQQANPVEEDQLEPDPDGQRRTSSLYEILTTS